MCQAAPGPRCFNDSSRKLKQLVNRRDKISKEITVANTALIEAHNSGAKASEIKKLMEHKRVLVSRLEAVELEVRHTQRDVDGTLTGRRNLMDELEKTHDPKAIENLEVRLRAGAALRLARETALEYASSGRPAPIRFAVKSAA